MKWVQGQERCRFNFYLTAGSFIMWMQVKKMKSHPSPKKNSISIWKRSITLSVRGCLMNANDLCQFTKSAEFNQDRQTDRQTAFWTFRRKQRHCLRGEALQTPQGNNKIWKHWTKAIKFAAITGGAVMLREERRSSRRQVKVQKSNFVLQGYNRVERRWVECERNFMFSADSSLDS